jgi:heme ABC exporter ATP-binding subunit CcmA
MSTISIKNVQKRYGRKRILRNLNLNVESSDFLVLFGPNGAGKTTLIKILSTLSRATSGEIVINGFDIHEDPIEVRNSIGVLSHNPLLYEDLTLKENLIFYSRMYGLATEKKEIKSLMNDVGLLHRSNDKVGEFSRGMKQRAAVARVILHNPPILLLDEPYTGLDFKAWDMLNTMLSKFHNKRKTILLITHNVELGHQIGSRLAVLAQGKIAYDVRKKDVDLDTFKEKYRDIMEGNL